MICSSIHFIMTPMYPWSRRMSHMKVFENLFELNLLNRWRKCMNTIIYCKLYLLQFVMSHWRNNSKKFRMEMENNLKFVIANREEKRRKKTPLENAKYSLIRLSRTCDLKVYQRLRTHCCQYKKKKNEIG